MRAAVHRHEGRERAVAEDLGGRAVDGHVQVDGAVDGLDSLKLGGGQIELADQRVVVFVPERGEVSSVPVVLELVVGVIVVAATRSGRQ